MRKKLFLIFIAIGFSVSAQWRSELYPSDWQPGYSNAQGQFLHDFSYAGYERGEKPLPETMNGLYANVLDYGADNTGANDATAAIQSAIDAVQNAGGGTVYLPAGTYKVKPTATESAGALNITGSNILLKGDGIGKTFIRCYAEKMRSCQVINVTNGGTWNTADDGNYYYLSQDVPATPTTTIHLNNVGNLKKGDWVIIRIDRTQQWIDEHNMGEYWYGTKSPTTSGVTFYRQIVSVDSETKTIEIDIPTRYYMKTRDNARVYKVMPRQSNVGLMDFSIGNKANSTTSGWGDNDYGTSGAGAYEAHNSFLVSFTSNINCFAKNIASYNPGNASEIHMLSNGINLNLTRSITVENCDFSYPQYEGGGGNGYGVNLCGQENLIKNCSSTSARHSFCIKGAYAIGNVIYHYTSTEPRLGSDFHMHFCLANLIDNEELNGDYLETIIRASGSEGNRHGYTSTQSVFWNTKGNYYKSGKNYVIDSRQYGYGYIIGTQGAATEVKTSPTEIAYNGYTSVDTAPEDYKEGIGQGATLFPQSLYYDQLERRLGSQNINTVTDVPGIVSIDSYFSKSSDISIIDNGNIKYAGNLNYGLGLDYYVNVTEAGRYTIKLNLAAGDAQYNTDNVLVKLNDQTVATVPVQESTGWENFITYTEELNFPSAGKYKLSLVTDTGPCNIADFYISKVTQIPTVKPADEIILNVINSTSNYGLEGAYNWNTAYNYIGQAFYPQATSNHKYLVVTYTGDITDIRFGNDINPPTKIYWFKGGVEDGTSHTLYTIDGGVVPSNGNNTTVVIDLERSGLDGTFFNNFHIHTGSTGTTGSLTISEAYLTETNPTPTDVENAKDNAEYIIINGRNITLQSNSNATMTIVNIYGQVIARNAQSAEMPAAGVYIVITENGKTKVYVK